MLLKWAWFVCLFVCLFLFLYYSFFHTTALIGATLLFAYDCADWSMVFAACFIVLIHGRRQQRGEN